MTFPPRSSIVTIALVFAVAAFDAPSIFPVSTRNALIQKSKLINSSFEKYASSGWSNRAGTVLTPVCTGGIYTADRPFLWNSIDVGCRCTVIELPSGSDKPDLWVHSPVDLDGPLKQVLDRLGTVKYVVSPNYEHVKFASAWYQAYPNAQIWGCPGLSERVASVDWTGEIPYHYRPSSWRNNDERDDADSIGWDANVIQPLHLDCEINPFTGRPFFNEVIFFHSPTKTLMTTDLFWNYPVSGPPNAQLGRANDEWELAPSTDVPWKSQLWKFGMDKIYYPFWSNFMIRDDRLYEEIASHILNVWDVETVIPAHGDILRGKSFVSGVLRRHLRPNR